MKQHREKRGEREVLQNYQHDKAGGGGGGGAGGGGGGGGGGGRGGGKGSEKRPFIVHHDSYQSDEIVMEIEEGNKKLQMIISKERNSII